jgi:hypothetical protein
VVIAFEGPELPTILAWRYNHFFQCGFIKTKTPMLSSTCLSQYCVWRLLQCLDCCYLVHTPQAPDSCQGMRGYTCTLRDLAGLISHAEKLIKGPLLALTVASRSLPPRRHPVR